MRFLDRSLGHLALDQVDAECMPHQQPLGTDHARDPKANPRGRRLPRRPIRPQPGRGQVEAHRRDQVVTEALHEHGPAQAAKDDHLTREATSSKHKVRKLLDTTSGDQMDVVGHQAVGPDRGLGLGAGGREEVEVGPVVVVLEARSRGAGCPAG